MRNPIYRAKVVSVFVAGAVVAGVALWLSLQTMSGDHVENRSGSDTDSPPDLRRIVTAKQMAESRGDSQALPQHQSRSEKLLGMWTKQYTGAGDGAPPNFSDSNWDLTVHFISDGRFIWDSKRIGADGNFINDSLTGKYSIERGFIIVYRFDEPSEKALKRLPMLFAFWPNQMLGRHAFRFKDDYLILGHDEEKIWFYLKRNGLESN